MDQKNCYLYLLAVGLCLLQCTSADDGIDKSLRFPKLQKGKFWVYQVKEDNLANGVSSVAEYSIREFILDTLTLNKQLMYFVEVSRKNADESNFRKIGSKLYYETDTGLFEKTSSKTYKKMSYPVLSDGEWYYDVSLGDSKTNLGKYIGLKESVKFNNQTYSNGIKIQVKNDSTGLYKNKAFEVFIPNLGMVSSELIDQEYCQETQSCIGKGIVIKSKVQRYTLIDTNN
ncbi:MAG: hypothetical protein ACRCVT_08605 [Leadbetterella sp.]